MEGSISGTPTSARKSSNTFLYAATAFIAVLVMVAAAAPLLAPADPTMQDLDARLRPPNAVHPLGTDGFGRDILSRIIFGTRSTLLVGIVAVTVAASLGSAIGVTAGMRGGVVESFLMLLMDSVLSFPTVLLAITVVSFLGYGLMQVTLAIGVIFSPVFARLVRAEALSLKTAGYVEAARSMGSSAFGIVVRHIAPNLSGKLAVQASVTFALSVVIEASLSYLGLGTQPPNPSWGLMLKDARGYLLNAPWLAIYPGVAIALTVLSFNILGDSLSERFNPRRRK